MCLYWIQPIIISGKCVYCITVWSNCNCSAEHTNVNIYPIESAEQKQGITSKMRSLNVSIKITFKCYSILFTSSIRLKQRKGFTFLQHFSHLNRNEPIPTIDQISNQINSSCYQPHIKLKLPLVDLVSVILNIWNEMNTKNMKKETLSPKLCWLFDLIVF